MTEQLFSHLALIHLIMKHRQEHTDHLPFHFYTGWQPLHCMEQFKQSWDY